MSDKKVKLYYKTGDWAVLSLMGYGKYRELQFNVSEKDHIDLYTIAEINRWDRVIDEVWFDGGVKWEQYRYAFYHYPNREDVIEYEVHNDDYGTFKVIEHVVFASRR